jgi:hypothetical protein
LLDKQTTTDNLTNVTNESIYTYDGTVSSPSYYGLQTQSVAKQYSGATVQGTTTSTTTTRVTPQGWVPPTI